MEIIKRDPYKYKQRWDNWIEDNSKGIEGISKENSKLILSYLEDMKLGRNVSPFAKKGNRSERRLYDLKDRLLFFAKRIDKPLNKLDKDFVHNFFYNMQKGKIRRLDGKNFISVGSYIKDFKAFWKWLMRKGEVKEDITLDLSRSDDNKPAWVYLSEEEFKKFANRCSPDYRAIVWFMYDTGMRVTEANSVKVKLFDKDFTQLTIPKEISKSLGRVINLKLCSSLVKDYIKFYNLKEDDFLFQKNPATINQYLRRLAKEVFGEKETKARGKTSEFTLYDIRHNASCFWLKRYSSTRALMYRMGWSDEKWIKYYSEFLGLSDELSDEDMVTSEEKTRMEKDISLLKTQLKTAMEMIEQNQERTAKRMYETLDMAGKYEDEIIKLKHKKK